MSGVLVESRNSLVCVRTFGIFDIERMSDAEPTGSGDKRAVQLVSSSGVNDPVRDDSADVGWVEWQLLTARHEPTATAGETADTTTIIQMYNRIESPANSRLYTARDGTVSAGCRYTDQPDIQFGLCTRSR